MRVEMRPSDKRRKEEGVLPEVSDVRQLELRVAGILRRGVIAVGCLLAMGWVWSLVRDGSHLNAFTNYAPQPFLEVSMRAWQERNVPMLVSLAGIALLLTLPLVRVSMTAFLFFRRGERGVASIAMFVLSVLVISMLLGIDT